MNFRCNDDDGDRIADDVETIARNMALIRSKEAGNLEFRSDIGGYIRVRRPVADGEDVVFLRIDTAAGSYRDETWDLDKFERYLKAGFLVDSKGEAFKQWARPYSVVEKPTIVARPVNPLQARIVVTRALKLARRLEVARDIWGMNSVLDLLAVSNILPEKDIDALREAILEEEEGPRPS